MFVWQEPAVQTQIRALVEYVWCLSAGAPDGEDRDTHRHSGQLFSAIGSDLTLTDSVSVDALRANASLKHTLKSV